jgi:hypothetical protein
MPQVLELLEKTLALSTEDREILVEQLVASRSEVPAHEGAEAAWGTSAPRTR